LRFHLNAGPILILLSSAVLSAPSLCAQNSPVTYPVHGSVVNSATHQPIARVLVEEGSIAALTDDQGLFELELPEGTQSLTVRRPGFRRTNQEHAILVGPNTPELNFELTPQVTVNGQVTLSSGEPADGVQIRAYRKSIVDNNRQKWVIVESIEANASGSFRFPALERGGSYIFCSNPTLEDISVPLAVGKLAPAQRFGYPPVCYPAPLPVSSGLVSDRNPANTVTLTAGQHADVELSLPREPFYHVMIPILNTAQWPNITAQIHSTSDPDAEYPVDWKPKLGYAHAYLPNGQYYFEAGHGAMSIYGRVDFRVANKPLITSGVTILSLHPIPVEIHRDFSLTQEENRSRVSSPDVNRIELDNPGVGIALASADEGAGAGLFAGGLTRARGNTDRTQFQIDGITPGRYWVETFPSEGYVESITSGGVDLTRQPIVIGAGNSAAPIVVNLRKDVGRLQITASPATDTNLPAQPASGTDSGTDSGTNQGNNSLGSNTPGEISTFFVYAIPFTRILWQTPQSQGQGAIPVTIGGLAPGQYCVVAFDRVQEFNLSDPETIARLTHLGQTVNVTGGATANVHLTVHHATGDEPLYWEAVD
jgi:hypothetical protein